MLDPLTLVEVKLVDTRYEWHALGDYVGNSSCHIYILSFIKKAPFDCFISTIILHYLESSKKLSIFAAKI